MDSLAAETPTITIPGQRCPFHHGPVDQCPPLDPELGDLLPDLIQRGVDIRIVPAGNGLPHCEDCWQAGTAFNSYGSVAVVAHIAPSEALPEGYVYRQPACAEHLWEVVIWELRRGCKTWIEIPAAPAQVA